MRRPALCSLAVTTALLVPVGCGDDDGTPTTARDDAPARQAEPPGTSDSERSRAGEEEEGRGSVTRGAAGAADRPLTPSDPLPNEGTSAVAPGVPTVRGGDNSIQTYGVEADSDQRLAAARVLKRYLDARAARDWTAACSLLHGSLRARMSSVGKRARDDGSSGCVAVMRTLGDNVTEAVLRTAAEIEVISMRVEPAGAFLIYRDGDGALRDIFMIMQGRRWRVGAVAGSPISSLGVGE